LGIVGSHARRLRRRKKVRSIANKQENGRCYGKAKINMRKKRNFLKKKLNRRVGSPIQRMKEKEIKKKNDEQGSTTGKTQL